MLFFVGFCFVFVYWFVYCCFDVVEVFLCVVVYVGVLFTGSANTSLRNLLVNIC